MRFRVLTVLFFVFLFSCQAKDTPADVKIDLMQSMQAYLYRTQVNNDSSAVKYHVKDVVYFEDPIKYICDFTVNMKERNLDTTGIMKATVSKDFKTVNRLN